MPRVFVTVDPRELRVTTERAGGPDLLKLHRQTARFGASAAGMPLPWVYEGTDGILLLYNGVTRAYRLAQLAPGTPITVEVVGRLNRPHAGFPRIGDLIP